MDAEQSYHRGYRGINAAFERARKRVQFALNMAESGLLNLDTMDEICRTLTVTLRDLEEVNSASVRELRVA